VNVQAEALNSSARITWSPPERTGDFPVTTYQVVGSPSGGCLVQSPALTCVITGLTNGVPYTFKVRALSGAGWGPYSTPSNTVTPQDQAPPSEQSIMITGTRAEVRGRVGVTTQATTSGLNSITVQARVRLPGREQYANGSRRTIGTDGTFTWQRITRKKVFVYFTTQDRQLRSNRIIIDP
jgi:hypothetical protein